MPIYEGSIKFSFDLIDDNNNNQKSEQEIIDSYLDILRLDHCQQVDEETVVLSHEEIKEKIKSLPPLKSFDLPDWHFDWTDRFDGLSMKSLAHVLDHSKEQLQSLTIGFGGHTKLMGVASDYEELRQSLRQLIVLEEFAWLVPHFWSVANVQNVAGPIIAGHIFGDIMQAKARLNSLRVSHHFFPRYFPLEKVPFQHANTLQTLSLSGDMQRENRYRTAVMILAANSLLTMEDIPLSSLSFSISALTCTQQDIPHVELLLRAATNAPSLRELEFCPSFRNDISDEEKAKPILTCAQLLKENTTLLTFSCPVYRRGETSKHFIAPICEAFEELLKTNTTLTGVNLVAANPFTQGQDFLIQHFVELNRFGRKQIVEEGDSMTLNDLINALANGKDSVNWIYFVLTFTSTSNPIIVRLLS